MAAAIKLLTTKNQLRNQIDIALSKRISGPDIVGKFQEILRKFIQETIEATSVWKSIGGDSSTGLDAHFGIPKGQNDSRRDALLDIWKQQIRVRVLPRRAKTLIAVRLEAIESDWTKVSTDPAGITTSKQGTLAWVDWLLNGNVSLDSRINKYNIQFDFDESKHQSRSGKAIMEFDKENPYQFPIDLVGGQPDANNNFISRAFEETITDKRKELKETFMRLIANAL